MEKLLAVLEQKIHALLDSKRNDLELIQSLKAEKEQLVADKIQLVEQLESLEHTILSRHKNLDEAHQERELTKMAVDELIRTIDVLFEQQSEQSC